MVFIISKEEDHSTNEVIKWLRRWELPFIRLGKRRFIQSINIDLSNSKTKIIFKVGSKVIDYDQVSFFWYRKYYLQLENEFSLNHEVDFSKGEYLNYLFKGELGTLYDFILFKLKKKSFIGNPEMPNANKLISFSCAKEVGFEIPQTYISNDLEYLKSSMNNRKWIIKPIQDLFETNAGKDKLIKYFSNITLADKSITSSFSEKIFPSCIQEPIPKKVEIRSFFIENKVFSMAIFSQLDDQTKLDFRRYNFDKPNRCVPFNLPKTIEEKIYKFMELMGLNTGSLDLILTPDNEYVFLEVNPSGQFGMVEFNTFFPLNKILAQKMKDKFDNITVNERFN